MAHQQDIVLFVVATPIGNLKDITFRALETLTKADLIASENVRKTRNLLSHHGIKSTVISYREENSRRVIPRIIDALGQGRSVALVTEAGTPGISDPGRQLVEAVWKAGYKIVPVPGASAVVAALSVSGMDEPRYVFEGFLPRKNSKRRRRLRDLADDVRQLVFFEAPHRLLKTLGDMKDILGDRRCVVAREMTKLHEDIEKASISSFIDKYTGRPPKGELVIVCEGTGRKKGKRGSEVSVIVYSTPTCPYCKMVKSYLDEKGVSFQDADVSSDPAKRDEMFKISGQRGVPVINIDGQIVVGFDKERLGELLGKE
ncbi:MAG: 16S rRNA (cytidine(1402)-2'-O)-methyltransferase [Candidatus Eisenbacteria bacterium]